MALANIADYEAITGTTVAAEQVDRIERLLDLSSSAVLAGAHGQLIEQTTFTDLVCRPSDGLIYLPQRPVQSITTVAYEGETITAGTGYRVEPGGDGRPALLIRRCDGRDAAWLCDVTVSGVAGWDPIPGQIISMVVAMSSSAVENDGGTAPNQDTAGPFSSSWDDPQPAGDLTIKQQATLDRLCGLRSPASVPTSRDYP